MLRLMKKESIFFITYIPLIAITILLLQACPGNNDSEDPGNTLLSSDTLHYTVAGGGYLSTNEGLSLYLPPGALPVDTAIVLEQLSYPGLSEDYVAVVSFKPEGMLLADSGSLTIPFSGEYVNETRIQLQEYLGNDPGYAVHTGRYGTVSIDYGWKMAATDNMKVTAPITRTNKIAFARNCHAGTVREILADFRSRGCDETTVLNEVSERFPESGYSEQSKDFGSSSAIKGLLETYFNEYGIWDKGNDLDENTLAKLSEFARAGRRVVLTFGDSYYNTFDHSTILEVDGSGEIQIRNTCKVGTQLRNALGGGEVVAYYPFSKVNEFRRLNRV